jgi:hypothetical protein
MRILALTVPIILLVGCATSEKLIRADEIYNIDANSSRVVVDDISTRAIRTMILDSNHRLTGAASSQINGAIAGATIGLSLATSQGILNIQNATTSQGTISAYQRATQAQLSGMVLGGALGASLADIATRLDSKKKIKELYSITGEESEAFNWLLNAVSRDHVGIRAISFIYATMALREKTEPILAQLYVDVAYMVMRSCRINQTDSAQKHCNTALNIMSSLDLPNQLAPAIDRTEFLPR